MKRKAILISLIVLSLLLVGCAYFEFCNSQDCYCYNNEKGLLTCVAVKYDCSFKPYYLDSFKRRVYLPASAKIEHNYPATK
jgi:hypothetical protein